MGKRENKVETYLHDEIVKLGGTTRKWVCPGHDGVPDRIIIMKCGVMFVEVKTTDGEYEPSQEREHERLRQAGAAVHTVWGHLGVDVLIEQIKKSLSNEEEHF